MYVMHYIKSLQDLFGKGVSLCTIPSVQMFGLYLFSSVVHMSKGFTTEDYCHEHSLLQWYNMNLRLRASRHHVIIHIK